MDYFTRYGQTPRVPETGIWGTGALIVIADTPDFSSRDQATPGYSAGHRDTAALWRVVIFMLLL